MNSSRLGLPFISVPGIGQVQVAALVLSGECPGMLFESPGDFPLIAPCFGFTLAPEDIFYTVQADASQGCSDASFIGRTFVFYSARPLPQGGAA